MECLVPLFSPHSLQLVHIAHESSLQIVHPALRLGHQRLQLDHSIPQKLVLLHRLAQRVPELSNLRLSRQLLRGIVGSGAGLVLVARVEKRLEAFDEVLVVAVAFGGSAVLFMTAHGSNSSIIQWE